MIVAATGPNLAEDLRRIGIEAGLHQVGICDARPFDEVRDLLEKRRDDGSFGGMQFTYRNPARSTDPARTVPGARSLVVGCLGYDRDEPDDAVDPGRRAAVARYSWVDHYELLRRALSEVSARLKANGWRAVVLSDDNALVDRAAAVRAGLGWYGKNCNVLIPGHGSWFVLGSVVTDAPLLPGPDPEPVRDGCRTCRRCIDDCPTGALVAPGHLDARRCLAWLLQAPGVFPREFREALGDRIYGCDACQDRCPVNRSARRRHPPPLPEHGSRSALDVVSMLRSDDAEIEREVGRWYIPGREIRYVRRNALVVLGNIADGKEQEVADVLVGSLGSADPVIRAHAVWATRKLGREDLLGPVKADPDPLVRAELDAPMAEPGESR